MGDAARFVSMGELRARAVEEIASQFDQLLRALCAEDDSLLTEETFRYVTGDPHPFGNLAMVRAGASAETVKRDVQALKGGAFPSAVILMDSGSAAQREAVLGEGFVFGESMPLMAVTPETLAETSLAEGYTMREYGVGDDEAWKAAFSVGYGLPESLGAMFGVKRAHDRLGAARVKYYGVEHEGELVATSLYCLQGGLAGIYGVATKPEHRGKGLGAHLTAQPLREAWGLGYRVGLLQASAMGAPVYRRIGFEEFGEMGLYVWMPG